MNELATPSIDRALTGVRPTGELTIANYLGAIQPIVHMQDVFNGDVNVFVADVHGLTDQEPDTVRQNVMSTARSLIAAGVDPQRSTLYLQSQIEDETVWLAHMFDRHTTLAELRRVPTIKDKVKNEAAVEGINMALYRYPVLMAADIAIQGATHVPVGEDQIPHIEFTRQIVRRFNNAYGKGNQILAEPKDLARKPLRISALKAEDGKMSKSNPGSALLLRDGVDVIARKIRRAQTAPVPAEMPDILKSHFTIGELLSRDEMQLADIQRLKAAHMAGEAVMGVFKEALTGIVNGFLSEFRERYESVSEAEVKAMLRSGGAQVEHNARQIVARTKSAMGLTPIL